MLAAYGMYAANVTFPAVNRGGSFTVSLAPRPFFTYNNHSAHALKHHVCIGSYYNKRAIT
jgi:hypothetical protein